MDGNFWVAVVGLIVGIIGGIFSSIIFWVVKVTHINGRVDGLVTANVALEKLNEKLEKRVADLEKEYRDDQRQTHQMIVELEKQAIHEMGDVKSKLRMISHEIKTLSHQMANVYLVKGDQGGQT